MSYAALAVQEGTRQSYLCILKPRVKKTGWTLHASGVYKCTFTLGDVSGVAVDGVQFSEVSAIPSGTNEWYFDYTNYVLYARKSGSDFSSDFITCTYNIYISTIGAHWYKSPLDNTSRVVYYEPYIKKVPELKGSLSDSLFGFLPIQSSSLVINNSEHFMEPHLFDSSFNKQNIYLYHCLDSFTSQAFEYDTTNIKLLITGVMADVAYDATTVSISIRDKIDLFNTEFRSSGTNFINKTDFPLIDENFYARPIRYIYGMVDGCSAINTTYVASNPTTTDNRVWLLSQNYTGAVSQTKTVVASPASTTTRTYLTSVTGLNIDDTVHINKATDEYVQITAVGADYIEHAALVAGAASSGDTVFRPAIGNVYIEQGGFKYLAMPVRDYMVINLSSFVCIVFNTSVETNLSITTLSGSENITCRVYGKANDVTLGGSAFGSNSSTYGSLTNIAVILFDLIKMAGISESEINLASFQSLEATGIDVGFSTQENKNANFSTYKDIISNILITGMLRLFLDSDSKWTVERYAPITTIDYTITDEDILRGSIDYSFSYSDIISETIVDYRIQESGSSISETVTSDTARLLHGVSQQKTYKSYLLNQSDAHDLARRLSYVFGDRAGQLRFKSVNVLSMSSINESVAVSREKLPGFQYVDGTVNTKNMSIIELNKINKETTITLDDQKGAADHVAGW